MNEYTFEINMKVSLPAFTADDAEEVVRDAVEDLNALGSVVTELQVTQVDLEEKTG